MKETFLMTAHHICEGHKSHNTALQRRQSIHFLRYQKQHVLYSAITSPSLGVGQNVLMPQTATIIVILIQAVDTLMGINKPDERMSRFTTVKGSK